MASCKKRAEESREAHEREMKRVEEARLTSTAAAARLRQREEAARRENARLRQETAYKTRSTVERTRKLAEAKMAVRNLAARCARTDAPAARRTTRERTRRRRGAYARASRDRCDVDDYACILNIEIYQFEFVSSRQSVFIQRRNFTRHRAAARFSSTRRVD